MSYWKDRSLVRQIGGASDRAVNNVGVAVKQFGELNTFVHVITAFMGLVNADAHLNGKVHAAWSVYRVYYLYREACTVLGRAAPFVGSAVEPGSIELIEKPAVSRMNGHHPKTAFLYKFCGRRIFSYYFIYYFFRHFFNLNALDNIVWRAVYR